VRELREAGINVVMVTGDAEATAEAIARQVGIITLDSVHRPVRDLWGSGSAAAGGGSAKAAAGTHASIPFRATAAAITDIVVPAASGPSAAPPDAAAVVVTGPELAKFSPPDWEWLLRHPEIVLARTTPEQKLEFVKAAQAAHHRVGVTGDGMNDAPALKNADVGVAMNSGSDAARDAAHVVLLTDDFSAMVHAVREGRLIFANLRKICAYLITGGACAALL
jgi:sodium/potassium-transporting ATPase subunit alpha